MHRSWSNVLNMYIYTFWHHKPTLLQAVHQTNSLGGWDNFKAEPSLLFSTGFNCAQAQVFYHHSGLLLNKEKQNRQLRVSGQSQNENCNEICNIKVMYWHLLWTSFGRPVGFFEWKTSAYKNSDRVRGKKRSLNKMLCNQMYECANFDDFITILVIYVHSLAALCNY